MIDRMLQIPWPAGSANSLLLMATGSILILTSCREGDYAASRIDAREESIQRVFESAAERESGNPQRLAEAGKWVDRELRQDAADTAANMKNIEDRFRCECERWIERDPERRETIGRILWGKPEQIERTAISMFY